MKDYLKALGRRKKAIRARKSVIENLERLMGGKNYKTYTENLVKIRQANSLLASLDMICATEPDLLERTLDIAQEPLGESYENVLHYAKVFGLQNPKLSELIAKANCSIKEHEAANDKLACTPKIRLNLEEYNDLTDKINQITSEWNIGK